MLILIDKIIKIVLYQLHNSIRQLCMGYTC